MQSILARPATALAAVAVLLGNAVGADAGRSDSSLHHQSILSQNFLARSKLGCCAKWCCRASQQDTMDAIDRDLAQLESVEELDLYRGTVADVATQYRSCAGLYGIFGQIVMFGAPVVAFPISMCTCSEIWEGDWSRSATVIAIATAYSSLVGSFFFCCGCCMKCNASDVDRYAEQLDSPAMRARVVSNNTEASFFAGSNLSNGVLALVAVCVVVCTISVVRGKETKLNRFRPEHHLLVVENTMQNQQPRHLWHGQLGDGATFVNPILNAELALGERPLLEGGETAQESASDLESSLDF